MLNQLNSSHIENAMKQAGVQNDKYIFIHTTMRCCTYVHIFKTLIGCKMPTSKCLLNLQPKNKTVATS